MGVQDRPQLHEEFKASLGYRNAYLNRVWEGEKRIQKQMFRESCLLGK